MKFVMSYSCGKDSTLALDKLIKAGGEPLALLIMINRGQERSYFHGADMKMLERYSKSLDIPLLLAPTDGADYHTAMESALEKAKELGADSAGFGDIDIDSNRAWCEQRCENVGLKALFPLWHSGREENVRELLRLGYKCVIKSVNPELLPRELLGRVIDNDVIEIMRAHNIDICGENGEYHTFTVDGPVFKTPVEYETGRVLDLGSHSVIEVI